MLVICPSRARVANITALLDASEATDVAAELMICLDVDDPERADYLAVIGNRANVTAGPWRSLCDWCNFIAVECRACWAFDIIGQIGDDHWPRTDRWDAQIGDAMQPLGVVYGNDLHQSERLPTAAFLDAEIVRRLGYMVPPEIQHLYMDNWFRALGERLGTLAYLPDVVIEHMHPDAGKSEMDDGYRQVNSRLAYRQGAAAFRQYMASRFNDDIEKVLAA